MFSEKRNLVGSAGPQDSFAKTPGAMEVVAKAEGHWGRNTIFDEYSKVLIVVQKSGTSLLWVLKGLYVDMARQQKSEPDRLSQRELTKKGNDIDYWIVLKRVLTYVRQEHLLMVTEFGPGFVRFSRISKPSNRKSSTLILK